jgi:acetyl-CoA acetyltransferase
MGPDTDLIVAACRAAADDAGIDLADIDGIGVQAHYLPGPDTAAIVGALGIREVNWNEDGGIGVSSVAAAADALAARRAKAIVVCKVMDTVSTISSPPIDAGTGQVQGPAQFDVPYGLGYTMQRVALASRRWMDRYGITEEQVGWLCITEREHAMRNPRAPLHDPITMQDYLASRWITEPLRLLDCDYPVHGAFAYILTREDQAKTLRHEPVYFLGWTDLGGAGAMSPHLLPEFTDGLRPEVEQLYADTGLQPRDMDVWMLYDGFSHLALQWIEELGLVERGQAGAYVEGGTRIRFDGEHPLNTNGGQLSEGRLHGAGHILEAVEQLRGTAGDRQAKKADHAIVSSIMPYAGAAGIFGRK